MKLKQLPLEYQKAIPVLKKLENAGYEAYFVGGSVRDILLNQPIHDVDIATSAFPEEIKQLFPKTIDIGIEHGTVLVLENDEQYEITTFRTESTYQDYRRPDHVEFVRSLEEDLKRRDFTINAFALKEDGEIIDLFDGLQDLEEQILRAVGNPHERFHEDALRMMRGLRFVSQLGFKLEEETFYAIKENHELLGKISVERINVEFIKMLLGNERSAGIHAFIETECYICCPGLREEGEMIKDVQALVQGLRQRKTGVLEPFELYFLGKDHALQVEELMTYFDETPQMDVVEESYDRLPIKSLSELAVDGKILLEESGKKPGKWVSEALQSAEKAVVEQRIENDKKQVLDFLSKEKLI